MNLVSSLRAGFFFSQGSTRATLGYHALFLVCLLSSARVSAEPPDEVEPSPDPVPQESAAASAQADSAASPDAPDPQTKPDTDATTADARPEPSLENGSPPADPPPLDSSAPPTDPAALASSSPPPAATASANAALDTSDPYEAYDQTGTPPPPPKEAEHQMAPKGEWRKDYDGRKEPARADEVLVWIPRAPLYPVHLVANYGLRWPIVGLMTAAEKHKVFQRVQDFFTFAGGKAGIYPLGFYDAGRGFWGGLNFFYNDLGREGHSLKATAGIGTANWILAQIRDSWTVFENDRGTLTFSATFLRNPNLAFTGLGPDTDIEDQVFFLEEKVEGAVDLEVALEGLNRFSMRFDFKTSELGPGRSPSIEESDFDAEGTTGFDDHYTLGGLGMALELDTRNPKDEFVPGSGLALKTWGSFHYGPSSTRLSFFRYGLHPRIIIDLTGANHVLQVGVHAEAISRAGGETLPFNELISLGGQNAMVGFLPGRFRGDSAFLYQLQYSWPLLSFADAVLFTELGNAFMGFFQDLDHGLMALDWGTGLRSSFSRELQVMLAVGFGTNQITYWQDAFLVDQIRFLVGATHRF